MFKHTRKLQYNAKPDRPDPLMARRLQESLGGQWGEVTGMMSYLSQGWSSTGSEKYKDLLLDTGTEEIAHVEMISTMIARLLEGARFMRKPMRTSLIPHWLRSWVAWILSTPLCMG